LEVIGLEYGLLDSFLAVLREMGADVMQSSDGIFRVKPGKNLHAVDVVTAPHPGFPTDLQAQLCSLLTQVDGVSTLTEVIYPDRFLHIPELGKLGADVSLENASAVIGGPAKLVGTRLQSTDLRASAALYIAGLCASGETHIDDVHHLDRGYEDLDGKLRALGADIERIES
jgi:UDP-N-acetylglucosamine 1-carboxyvinyltransferase